MSAYTDYLKLFTIENMTAWCGETKARHRPGPALRPLCDALLKSLHHDLSVLDDQRIIRAIMIAWEESESETMDNPSIWHVYCLECGYVNDEAMTYDAARDVLNKHKAANKVHTAVMRPQR